MRELKFRSWNDEKYRYAPNRFVYTDDYDKDDVDDYESIGHFFATRDNIEQYTGLKDKNGREIYEGDIVEQFVCGVKKFKGKEVGHKTVWQVRWNEEECCFELHYLSGSLFGDSLMAKGEEYEVIGNIHENKELLDVQ